VLAEPVLPGRVTRDISAVVVERAGLDFLLAGSVKEGELVGPQVRVVILRVRAGSDVALPRRHEGKEVLPGRLPWSWPCAGRRSRIRPTCSSRGEASCQAVAADRSNGLPTGRLAGFAAIGRDWLGQRRPPRSSLELVTEILGFM
jgi:hypothetical protein